MMKEKLYKQIFEYTPVNEQEKTDRETFLAFLESGEDISHRDNRIAHLTASAWVVSPDRKKVLMAYHKLYDSWAWLGGHADGNFCLSAVAEKEAREESGIENLRLISEYPVSLETLTVSGHEKRGAYVPSHLHLNLTYLFEAEQNQRLRVNPDENSGVDWVDMDALAQKCSEPWFVERIYSKLVNKAKSI